MELSGDNTERWEQFGGLIGDVADEIAKQSQKFQQMRNEIDATIELLNGMHETLVTMGDLAYKEVLRAESNTLNGSSDADQSRTTAALSQKSSPLTKQ